MINGFAYGFGEGGMSGGLHDANVQLNQWADGVATSSGPLGWIARQENDVISKAYGPVSDAIGTVAGTASHAVSTADHLASKAESLLGKL
jgi:hypothetical protein